MRRAVALTLFATLAPLRLVAQSEHLAALEASAPASVLDATAGTLGAGLGGLWIDPTAEPSARGAFFDLYQATVASVQMYHAVLATRFGPRWSFIAGSTEIKDLFDSSLISQDPRLANLRARAWWLGVDATTRWRSLTGSVGMAAANDENVGDYQTSTVARANLRVTPVASGIVSIGVHTDRAIGGSIPRTSGRAGLDLSVQGSRGAVNGAVSLAVSRGQIWRYSETRGAEAVAVRLSFFGELDLGVGLGHYETTFGAQAAEWSRSVLAGLRVGRFMLDARYTNTEIGLGTGYGIALRYGER